MLELRPGRPDDPDATAMTEEVQRWYAELYGAPDVEPVDVDGFVPPRGRFLIAHDAGRAVGMGGWTRRAEDPDEAKVRRMYVRPAARRLGVAGRLLDALEGAARDAGARRMVLETGVPQEDAVRFYRARGYTDVPAFGFYADSPESVHLGKTL